MDFYNNQYMNYRQNYNMPQMAQIPQPQQKSNLDWITVQSIAQVEQVNVLAGSKAWVMVQNEPIFALRVADNMGLVTTEYYKFEKYEPTNAKSVANKENFVTREEMLAEIEKLKNEVKLNESAFESKPIKK